MSPSDSLGSEAILRLLFGTTAYVGGKNQSRRATPTELYAPLPRASRATLLVPTLSTRATAATLRDYASSNTARARVLSLAGSLMGRVGLFKLWRSKIVVVEAPGARSLMSYAKELFGTDVSTAIQLGPPRPNRKPIVALRAPGGVAQAYMKVGINALTKARVANESRALLLLGKVEDLDLDVPPLLRQGEWGELNYIITGAVDTRSAGSGSLAVTSLAMTSLARKFTGGSPDLAESPWWLTLIDELTSLSGAEAEGLHTLATRLVESRRAHPITVGAAHGDWAPWNMAVSNGRAMVWDWERFRIDVPVGWDAIHFEIETNRRSGLSAEVSIAQLIPAIADIVARNGAKPADGRILLATFLLDLGTRQLITRSASQPDSRGDIRTWLVPPLDELLSDLADAPLA